MSQITVTSFETFLDIVSLAQLLNKAQGNTVSLSQEISSQLP